MEMDKERKARGEDGSYPQLMSALIKGQRGCGFVPQTHSEKLATMLII